MQSLLEKKLLHSVWGLAGLGLLTLISTRELETAAVVFILFLYPLFFHFEMKDRLPKTRWLENGLILAFFFLSAARLVFVRDPFLMVVADFLVSFTLLKLLFKKTRTDLLQIAALSFFLVLSAATLALDFTFFFLFLLFVLLSAWTLGLHALTEENAPEPQTEKSDLPVRSLLRFLTGHCGVTLAISLTFSLGIFIFFPRLSLALFQGAFLGPSIRSGYSDRMTLGRPGKIYEDPTVAMRVEISSRENPGRYGLYLRGQSLSRFNGRQWTRGEKDEKLDVQDAYRSRVLKIQKLVTNRFRILHKTPESLKASYGLRLDQRSYLHQKIYLESVDTLTLFGVPWVESLQARLPEMTVGADRSFSRPARFPGRMAYEVVSITERPSEKTLIGLSLAPLSREQRESPEVVQNLLLPDGDLGRIRELAGRIVSRRDSGYAKAKKIEAYLSQNYAYRTNPRVSGDNPLENFLFDSREGHCEYFASAMALMLRLEGIPARIATGFLMEEWNPQGKYYLVRSRDAHSWVECFLGGVWMEFDPTPRDRSQDANAASLWAKARQNLDYLNFLWNAHVLGYDMESQRNLAYAVQLKSGALSASMDRSLSQWRTNAELAWRRTGKWGNPFTGIHFQKPKPGNRLTAIWVGLLQGVLAAFVLILAFLKRGALLSYVQKTLGRGRCHPSNFYLKLSRILARKGYRRRPSETPREFAERIVYVPKRIHSHVQEDLHSKLLYLTDLYYRTRFSDSPIAPNELKEAKVCIKKIGADLPRLQAGENKFKIFIANKNN